MSESVTLSAPPLTGSPPLLSPALFTLDSNGVIRTANSSAAQFWQTTAAQLVGTPLVRLLSFDGTSVASAGPAAQWAVLLSHSLDHTSSARARLPLDANADVSLRIEPAHGGTAGYFVIVEEITARKEPAPPLLVDSGLALLADQGAVGFFDIHFQTEHTYYSPAWKRLLGYGSDDLANTYESWRRLIHPDDSSAAPDQLARKLPGGVGSFSAEIRMQHRNGHYVWVHCIGVQVADSTGELERVTGMQIDIHERKELEEQSIVSAERLDRISRAHGLASFDFDFSRGRYWLSSGWTELTGDAPAGPNAELASFMNALPPGLSAAGAEAFFLAHAPEHDGSLSPLMLRHRDGREVPVLFGVSRQTTRRNALSRAIGFCCALPPELSSLRHLPLPAQVVAATLASVNEGVIVTNNAGRVLYLNPHAERLAQCPAEHARGLPLTDVFRLGERGTGEPDDDAVELALAASDSPALCGDHALLTNTTNGAATRPIVWTARPLRSSDGRVEGTAIVFRDPQEMTLTPEELLKINRWESLGVIAGGIAHDFNNLLTTILGGISHAKDNRDNSYLPDSERACMAAKALTKQLLDAAKGGGPETSQILSPVELLRDAIRLARAGSSVEIKLTAPDTVAPVRINRSQMLQVFQNLIVNALQATPTQNGKLCISANNVRLEDGAVPPLPTGDYIEIEVRDNGSGIAPENLERIFEPFFTTKKHGTGLGLHTVRNIVRKHSGQIRVSSTVGQGTCFQIDLPQADRPVDVEVRRAPMLHTGTGRVLLMDDDPDIARLAGGMLASLDYKYDLARNGEEALTLYQRYINVGRPYDLVILDLTVVGGMGGDETFVKLRDLDQDVQAIVCSGYDSDELARHYLELGFAGYLAKPFRLGDLARAIKTVLG